jgi:thiosulfate/3-mercaptopyruvate sulfurtransferase
MANSPLISPAELAARLAEPALRLVDCRFTLGRPGAGRERYLAGHLPGAAFLDLDADLSGREGGGRHPLPTSDDFAASARRAGIGAGSFVVAYDDAMTGGAARLWWLLRHFGHDHAAVLDGGLAAWDGPLQAGEQHVAPGDFTARPRQGDTVDADDVLAHLDDRSRVLLDARAPERYGASPSRSTPSPATSPVLATSRSPSPSHPTSPPPTRNWSPTVAPA